jgi:hypothetical protein
MKETTIIITTAITVQSEDNVDRDEIVCSVKTALRVDNSKLLDSLTLMEEEQTDDELVSEHSLNPIPPVSQEEFNKAFHEILKGSTQRYLNPKTEKVSEKKTSRIEVLDSNNKWLIIYNTAKKNPSFLYSYFRVLLILRKQFSLQDDELQVLMKRMVEDHFKMKGVTPYNADYSLGDLVEDHFKMKGVTPSASV